MLLYNFHYLKIQSLFYIMIHKFKYFLYRHGHSSCFEVSETFAWLHVQLSMTSFIYFYVVTCVCGGGQFECM